MIFKRLKYSKCSKYAGLYVATICLLFLGMGTAHATGNFGVGTKLGTTGIGLEGTFGMTEHVNLRASISGFNYSLDLEEEDIEYDGRLRLRNAGLLADWHPFSGGFRVSAGGFYNGNKFNGSASGQLDIGNSTYTADLDLGIDFRRFAPYLGLGYGNAVRSTGLSFAMDVGVMFAGSPRVGLEGELTGPDDSNGFQDDLRRERQDLEDELDSYKYWPVLTIGLSYRF